MLLTTQDLREKLRQIEQKDYVNYQDIKGHYDFGFFELEIFQIPKDPFAPPFTGIYRILIKRDLKELIKIPLSGKDAETAYCDFLARRFNDISAKIAASGRGTAFSGEISVSPTSQAILRRSNVLVHDGILEIRCFIGLPAKKRIINAELAQKMFFDELTKIVEQTIYSKYIDEKNLLLHCQIYEDSIFLRKEIAKNELVAFVRNDAILPRQSSTSDKVLDDHPVHFKSPSSLEYEFNLPHSGKIKGMGIPKGVTLIVGGGFHGKSTVLESLQDGIYNHIIGDGRELCVSSKNTVKVRAYSGRIVNKTNISTFINNLPFQKNVEQFSSEKASGSTSQAASIIEAIEVGADLLLMDEDSCATNFMLRDKQMQELIESSDEPITPFIDRVRQLYEEKAVSTILVLGGIGDYFDVCDTVIQMKNYQAIDVTEEAKRISKVNLEKRSYLQASKEIRITNRYPLAEELTAVNANGHFRIYHKSLRELVFGDEIIDISDIEQFKEESQLKTLGFAINFLKNKMNGKHTLKELLDLLDKELDRSSLDLLFNQYLSYLSEFRSMELAFVLNRMRQGRFRV